MAKLTDEEMLALNNISRQRDPDVFLGAALQRVIDGLLASDGRIFWVDPTVSTGEGVGDDDNDGLTPETAFKTRQAGIDACEDWRGDIVIVKAGTETVTTPVLFNKKGITVITENVGLPPRSQGERFMTYGSHIDGPAAIISKPCQIVGLGFCGSQADGASLVIDGEVGSFDGGDFAALERCRFSHWGIAKAHALILKGTGDVEIGHCYFDGFTAGYTVSAIQAELAGANGTWASYIHDNLFMNPTTYALMMKTGAVPVRGVVKENTLIGAGKFFNANSVAGSFGFYGNWLPTPTDTGSYNDTVANLKTDGYKFAGNHYSE